MPPHTVAVGSSPPRQGGPDRVVRRLASKQRVVVYPGCAKIVQVKQAAEEGPPFRKTAFGLCPPIKAAWTGLSGGSLSSSESSSTQDERRSPRPGRPPKRNCHPAAAAFGSCPPIKAARTGLSGRPLPSSGSSFAQDDARSSGSSLRRKRLPTEERGINLSPPLQGGSDLAVTRLASAVLATRRGSPNG